MKKISTRVLSLFLVTLMIFSAMPMVKVEAEAAGISNERQKVIDYMMSMATVKWTAGASFSTLHGRSYKKGNTYYGIPYSQTKVKNSISNTVNISYDTFITMLKNNNGKINKDIGRNDCSYAVCKSFAQADANVSPSTWTGDMRPGLNNLVAVGDYKYIVKRVSGVNSKGQKTTTVKDKRTTCDNVGRKKMIANYSLLQPGDAVVNDGHTMLVVGVDTTKKMITVVHQSGASDKKYKGYATSWGINETRTFDWLYNNGYIPITCKALANSVPQSYKITLNGTSNITNTSATINVSLDKSATVAKWTYFLSTNKSDVSNVKGAVGSTHKNTATMDCVRINDYTKNPRTQKSDTFTIEKYQGNPLKPGTTYYYKATVCINGKWYESTVGSFKTAANKPGVVTTRISGASQKVGISDQITILWDAASGAESYNVSVKNSNGTLVQSKTGIKGLTCVLNGMSAAGTYTVTVDAVNDAGKTAGKSATFIVMPDVTVKFYDTIAKKVLRTQTVHWGHNATAPANPSQNGHTFSKWDSAFTKVTSDITVNTVYDRNTYTVKFVDSFTNKVLKTQYVKYGDSATVPSVSAPTGYSLTGWDKSYTSVKSDLTVYTVYKWTDTDNTATATINSVVRNTTKKGYDVNVTVSNKISAISSGRVVVVLKSNNGVILTSTESAAFAIDSLGNKTLSVTVLYDELAPKVEVYVVNGFEGLGQISRPATANINNSTSSAWSGWITYTGTCPMSNSSTVTVETKTITNTTPAKYYYRYQTKETTTSYNTSLSGYTQNGYSLVKSSSGTIDYVSSWPSGFNKSNSLYTTYNKTPKSASESSTQKVVIDSTSTAGYIYWHWCRGDSVGAINRAINWSKTSTFDTFHAFYSGTKKSYDKSANAYKWQNTSACKDTYWWNGHTTKVDGLVTVKRQNYSVYNKLYNYYKYSGYTGWIEMSTSTAPISNGQSAGTNKTYQNVETKVVPATTTYTYQYRYKTTTNPTITEPSVSSNRIYNLSGNVGSSFAGKSATLWVYKFDGASDYTVEYVGTTTVGSNGSVTINNAVLREAPTVDSGNYTIVASVAGQLKAIEIGEIEAPKRTYTVKFYDFDRTTVVSTQTVTEGGNAELPSDDVLTVPEGSRFTNWSESVVNVRSDLGVFPLSETKTFVVAFVNWEVQTVSLKEFNYGAELVADGAPESKDGFVTEWVVMDGDEYLTIDEFTEAGKTVTGNMVVETLSKPLQHTVTIVDADKDKLLDSNKLMTEGKESFDVADEYTVENGGHIDFSKVQESIEENPEYIFTGWINAHTGEYIEETTITEDTILYPSYIFAESTIEPYASIVTGEYTETQTVELKCDTEKATIWYTTDGTEPASSESTKEYTAPITIDESCVLRFYATSVGRNDSMESTETYAINTSGKTPFHVVTIYNDMFDGDSRLTAVGLVKEGSLLPNALFTAEEGYDFGGLYYDEEFNEQFYHEFETITESLELYAKYSLEKYNVVFKDYDGNVIDTQTVERFASAKVPSDPSRDGYVFIGWSGETDCITEDVMFTAQYLAEDEYATVSINRTRPLTLAKGTTFTYLTANVSPAIHSDYEKVWTTSDASVVEVNEDGVITAIDAGTATITVTLPYTNASASIKVVVVQNSDLELVLKDDSVMGFDSWGYIRGVPSGKNSVLEIGNHFSNEELTFYDHNSQVIKDDQLIGTGSVVKLEDGATVLDQATFILTGDINGDGAIDVLDATIAQRATTGNVDLEEPFTIALDSNGDGELESTDYQTLINLVLEQ